MAITLDPATEQRIQREVERGHFASPDEVVSQALDLLDAERDWMSEDRQAIHDRIEESFAAAARGETYTPEQARAILAERRTRQ
jgi:Arc/MetJ-type ribon-helix-helix transcriptional regulator